MDSLPKLSPAEIAANQGPKVAVIAAIVYGLAVVSVALRFLSRRISRCGLQADDWLILGAVTLSMSSLILSILRNSVPIIALLNTAHTLASGAERLGTTCPDSHDA